MDVERLRRDSAKGGKIPSNVELSRLLPNLHLLTKPRRTGSGVAVVAVMTRPFRCPHGVCSYCPGGPGSAFGDVPQSYTGTEPATMRGKRNEFDPFRQIFNRLEQYTLLGHRVDKVELIIMGGTFPSFPKEYQESFITECFSGMNTFSRMFLSDGKLDEKAFAEFIVPQDFRKEERRSMLAKKIDAIKARRSLEREQEENESSHVRCVALCIETRPDYAREPHINEMLRFGTTRVEMGVQQIHDDILTKVHRGHSVRDSIVATRLLKDSFLKVGYHLMPGLPLSTRERDIAMGEEIFINPEFRPDALKIYPCMVMRGTALHREWERGEFTPLSTSEAVDIISEMMRKVPEWCRVMRVQRDIPSTMVEGGVDRTNLRQYLDQEMTKRGIISRDIRSREPFGKTMSEMKLFRTDYEASGGTEVFLSFEDKDRATIYGFCRLRIPGKPFRPEITSHSAGIRELHVYGRMASLGSEGDVQHRGLGKRLVEEAKKISLEFGKKELLVISGIGVREYYQKLGFERKGTYMALAMKS